MLDKTEILLKVPLKHHNPNPLCSQMMNLFFGTFTTLKKRLPKIFELFCFPIV